MRILRRRLEIAHIAAAGLTVAALVLGVQSQVSVAAASTASSPGSAAAPAKPVKGHHAAALQARATGKSSASQTPNESTLPAAGSFTVDTPAGVSAVKLKTKGAHPATVAGTWSDIGLTGLRAAAATAGQASPAARVNVSVVDAATARKHHLSGLVLEVSRADGKTSAAPVAVQVPQKVLEGLYGANYASRIRWVQVPADTSVKGASSAPVTVASTTDATTSSVVATPMVTQNTVMLAAMSAPVSSTGTGSFAATPLSSASTWDVSGQTGDFTWQYAMRTPPAAAGPAPSLALVYDSQSVDGETGATNNQPSAVGEGWSLSGGGFIERTYVSCSLDNGASGPVTTSGDLCWKSDNATISVAGHAGQLVKDSTTGVWKLQADDGTRFEHLVGAAAGCGATNGTYDDDCWRMTTTDGTQYYFGMNQLPGWASGKATTNSAWTAPVYGNDAGEPCHASTFATSACTQAWRWNLDFVVDVHGNAEALYYDAETNKYAQNGSGATTYTRGGQLDHIDYGLRSNNIYGTNAASDRATFGYDTYGRCSDTTHANCTTEPLGAAVAPAHPTYYPDVPFDQLCTGTTCTQVSPSFFTDGMLDTVTTAALISGAYQTVDTWTLSHSFPAPGDGTNAALWMTQVSHTGSAAGQTSITEPPTVFTGTTMQNRVWVVDGLAPLDKWRISSIQTSLGAVISVNYSAQQCTAAGAPAIEASPWSNTNWCFPAWWTPGVVGAQTPQEDLFHKYVVTSVIANPETGGGLDLTRETDYSYGTPRWRYDTSPLTIDSERTWNQYAGVDTRETRVGDHGTPSAQKVTDDTYYQGMDGDRAGTSGGTKSVNVLGTSIPDSRWFAGTVYEEKTLLGVGGAVLSDTINTPWASGVTSNDGTNTARLTGTQDTVTTQPVSTGGNRTNETKTTFDTTYGLPLTVSTIPSDAAGTCTTTTYASANTTAWIIGLPQDVQKVGVTCANLGSATYPHDLISDVRTTYDNAALGVIGAYGDVTGTSQIDSYTGSTPHWQTTSALVYDTLGRTTSSTDVLGHTTTTAYTPAAAGPLTSETVTNTLSWTATTAFNPEWGAETSYTDQNTHLTTATYDALGRRTQVWTPTHTQAANPTSPTISYAYTLSQTAANAATTTSLVGGGTTVSYALYDGLGQAVQTQTQAFSGGGTMVATTNRDAAGNAYWTDNAYWTTSVSPSTTLFVPSTETSIPSQTRTTFDAAGRATAVALWQTGTERFETDTAYSGADRVDTTPPTGGTATSVYTNTVGEKTRLVQYLTGTVTGTGQATTYGYDAAGRMTTMTDPAGNAWSWGFDVLGHQTTTTDPDTGTTTATFDDAGNQLSSTDARGQQLTYTYDTLNRKTAQYAGTTSGSLLASWVYDTVAKGDLTSSTAYTGSVPGTPGLAYTTTVGGYDAGDKPTSTTVSIPAGAPAFAGTTYTVTDTYNVDESVANQTDPAAGGLPSEVVAPTYASDGQISSIKSTGLKVASSFTPIGQLSQFDRYVPNGFSAPVYEAVTAIGHDQATGQVMTITDGANFAGTGHQVAQRTYTRDNAGDVTSVTRTAAYPTASTLVDCYTYDGLGELTQVFTPGSGSTCATTPSTSILGGPAPVWDTYTYDTTTGNRTAETVHATATSGTDVTGTYAYPAAGAAHPHAISTVTGAGAPGAGTYGVDAAGNQTSAPGQTLTYDARGKLSSVTASAGTQANVYDPSAQLLLQTDPTAGASLYLGDTVLHQTGTGPVSGVRTFTSTGGVPVVERTATTGVSGSTLTWLYTDIDHTVDVQTVATTGATTAQYRDPYGAPIGSTGVWADGNGYLNKPSTTSTGLSILGDRAYHPVLGTFTSADAVLATGNPLQVGGYTYSGNNPVTDADPTGDCYEAASDSLTHSVNCAGGHAVNLPSATTVAIAHRTNPDYADRTVGWAKASVNTGKRYTGYSGPKNGWQAARDIALGAAMFAALVIPAAVLTELFAGGSSAGAGAVTDTVATAGETAEATDSAVATAGQDARAGQEVFRVWGKDPANPDLAGQQSGAWGRSWTRVDPRTVPNYRDAAGLPDDANLGRFLSRGILEDTSGVTAREALALGQNAGGLDELLVPYPESQINLLEVLGVNPPF